MIAELINRQDRALKGRPLASINKRKELLSSLYRSIENCSQEIYQALQLDLGKSKFEAYVSEIDFVLHEIKRAIKMVDSWAKPKRVGSPWVFFPAQSYIYPEPYGKVLIIGPWNYPFMLVLSPLIGALAAGNQAIIKPSEISVETSKIITKVINQVGEPDLISVVEGGIEETSALLDCQFDYIFYTGNGQVGLIILERAAKNLTPTTLELGGKSPCLVYTDRIDLAAKRVVWGKFFNAGQSCVAPDYVLLKPSNKAKFVDACKKWLTHFYGQEIDRSADYGRVINSRHFNRICNYFTDAEVLWGNVRDAKSNYLSPTLLDAKLDSKIMEEEIFGPVLPIIEVDDVSAAIDYIASRDKPLAAYGFFDAESDKQLYIARITAGGMVINDTLIHLSNANLPFGGVGESGIGAYHGHHSFETFSHKKSVMRRSFYFENSLRYPPYAGKLSLIRKILALFG